MNNTKQKEINNKKQTLTGISSRRGAIRRGGRRFGCSFSWLTFAGFSGLALPCDALAGESSALLGYTKLARVLVPVVDLRRDINF